MENCSPGNVNLNKTFIISSIPVTPVLPCSAVTTNIMFSCDGSNTFTFTGNTITPYKDIVPLTDNVINIGTTNKRFRNINTVNGRSTIWTSTNRVNTPNLNLGLDSDGNQRVLTANNSILQNDILLGGRGGTNSPLVSATSGGVSYISIQPNINAANLVLINTSGGISSGAAGAGVAGTGSAPAGGGGLAYTPTIQLPAHLGIIQSVAGQAGGAGGANVPTNITITLPVTGGGGGGGVTAAGTPSLGANITGAGFVPTILGGIAGDGNNGFGPNVTNFDSLIRNPFFSTGGGGGASSPISNGTRGGDGYFGSGGGGGGASYIGTINGGAGGNGGDGIVIISSWN